MKLRLEYLKPVGTFVLGLAAFLFWMLVLPYHVHYQEEIQYFPYTLSHFLHAFAFPGGMASWTGEFLVQFFHLTWAGALILAALTVLVHLVSYKASGRFELSFLPALLMWVFFCDAGNLLSMAVAYLAVVSAWILMNGSKLEGWLRLSVAAVLTVVLYVLCGPVAYLFVFLEIFHERSWKPASLLVLVALMLGVAFTVYGQYPVKRLFLGVEYNFVPGEYTASYWMLMLSLPAICLLGLMEDRSKSQKAVQFIHLAELAVLLAAGWGMVKAHVDSDMERVYAYDYLSNQRDWKGIIALADEKTPRTPPEVTCLNLALVMDGVSGDKLFSYFQSGIQGLFPNYDTYVLLKMCGSEALYQAGLLNMAMHYSFEAYQTFPGARESSRHLKRLAEVNMIIGNWAVAGKYLRALEPTLFYGKWAKQYLEHPESLTDDPEYARLSQYLNDDPDIFDDMYDFPKQEILRSQVRKLGKADESYHYLLAYDLLTKDVEGFVSDFALARIEGPVPVLYQQALLLPWMMQGGIGEPDAPEVSSQVLGQAKAFLVDMNSGKSLGYLKTKYGKTTWYNFGSQN